MRSRVLALGIGGAAILSAAAVVGSILSWWWLTVGAAMALLSATSFFALDADRRSRRLQLTTVTQDDLHATKAALKRLRTALENEPSRGALDLVEELHGSVRVQHEQYAARLARLEFSLDEATEALKSTAQDRGGKGQC